MLEPNLQIKQEIIQIEQQLAQKRAELQTLHREGSIDVMPNHKETLHEVVRDQFSTGSSTQSEEGDEEAVPLPPQDADTPSYLTRELKDKVQEHVNEAFNSSILSATKKVRATKNPALIDAFHDALVDQLYAHLVEQGKLKELDK